METIALSAKQTDGSSQHAFGIPHTFSMVSCWSFTPALVRDVIMQVGHWDFSSSSTGSWPKNFDISTMVYGITIRLAGMKALAVTKQLWANCVGSLRETDAGVRYPQNTDFSRTVGTTATKLTGMTVPPVSNPRQTNSDCTIRQTRSLFYQLKLTTAAIFTW